MINYLVNNIRHRMEIPIGISMLKYKDKLTYRVKNGNNTYYPNRDATENTGKIEWDVPVFRTDFPTIRLDRDLNIKEKFFFLLTLGIFVVCKYITIYK
jgi:hypothetical protein